MGNHRIRASCILPALEGRLAFGRQAVSYFRTQDYENKELILVTSEPEKFADIEDHNIKIVLARGQTDCERITQGIHESSGDVIFRWDDDDISFRHRISATLKEFLHSPAKVMGWVQGFFFEYATRYVYYCPPIQGDYMHPTGVMWRDAWEGRNGCKPNHFAPLVDLSIMMIGVHQGNTINKRGWMKYRTRFEVNKDAVSV